MIETPSTAAAFSPPPRRKYTVSDRGRAALLRNLERANAVPPEIRFRSTPRRRQACHRNLKLALAAKKRDRSINYATSLRHGWYVADPERALALVGATPEEYHRHLEAWRREVKPRDAREAKLAHALGMLSWRWLSGLRLEGDREVLAVYRLLAGVAEERRAGQPLTAERLETLVIHIDRELGAWDRLMTPLEKIRDRMLLLWQELLRSRGEPLFTPRVLGFGQHAHRIALHHDLWTAYVLAGPFQRSRRTGEAMQTDPAPLTEAGEWADAPPENRPDPAADPSSGPIAGPAGASCSPPPENQYARVEAWGDRASGATAAGAESAMDALEAKAAAEGRAFRWSMAAADAALLREARRRGWKLPGEFAGFLGRVQAAIGGLSSRRRAGAGGCGTSRGDCGPASGCCAATPGNGRRA